MPPLLEQLRAFARARVVVAPHGAGEVHVVASARRTCVVELLSHDAWFNLCYARLSYLLGHDYAAVSMRREGPIAGTAAYAHHRYVANDTELARALGRCQRRPERADSKASARV